MSNFICSECGMNNIDCGYAGYKTPKEIELEQQVERLQKQLNEAKEVISIYRIYDDTECGKATEYCKKWGVK